jgi:hypothetical protein
LATTIFGVAGMKYHSLSILKHVWHQIVKLRLILFCRLLPVSTCHVEECNLDPTYVLQLANSIDLLSHIVNTAIDTTPKSAFV